MPDVLAVDLGGTNIRVARVDEAGKILAHEKIPTPAAQGMGAVIADIAGLAQKLRAPDTLALGVGTPGVPDNETGVYRLAPCNLPCSHGFQFTAELKRLITLPVVADNDGNLAALGESWLGAGKNEHIVIIFTLGTGIGGGVVINGRVYHGHHNLVAEFGHVSIDYRGRLCNCGDRGCVETYASASALGRDAQEALRNDPAAKSSLLFKRCGGEAGIDKVDAHMVCDATRDGDPFATALLDRCCAWLACGISSVVNCFNPSCVILGGGMALAGDLITSRVNKCLDRNTRKYVPIWRDAKLVVAQLGDDAGILGAARMAWQHVEECCRTVK
jgi:glucokinase